MKTWEHNPKQCTRSRSWQQSSSRAGYSSTAGQERGRDKALENIFRSCAWQPCINSKAASTTTHIKPLDYKDVAQVSPWHSTARFKGFTLCPSKRTERGQKPSCKAHKEFYHSKYNGNKRFSQKLIIHWSILKLVLRLFRPISIGTSHPCCPCNDKYNGSHIICTWWSWRMLLACRCRRQEGLETETPPSYCLGHSKECVSVWFIASCHFGRLRSQQSASSQNWKIVRSSYSSKACKACRHKADSK